MNSAAGTAMRRVEGDAGVVFALVVPHVSPRFNVGWLSPESASGKIAAAQRCPYR
jgi:hypothetical protein